MALAGEICDAFDELDFGKIVIGAKMPSNAGGYYTKKQHCPGIYLPQSKDTCTIDLENQKFIIEFTVWLCLQTKPVKQSLNKSKN